jgi:hypothetical protein
MLPPNLGLLNYVQVAIKPNSVSLKLQNVSVLSYKTSYKESTQSWKFLHVNRQRF